MIGTVAWPVVALVLLAAAVLKAADRTATAVALSGARRARTAGRAAVGRRRRRRGRAGRRARRRAALGADRGRAALLAVFAGLQAVALARGGSGAPCGCFGARGRLSRGSLGRTALLAAACAALPRAGAPEAPPARPHRAPSPAGAAVARARPRGRRLRGDRPLELDGEGPALGAPSPWRCPGDGIRLALFTGAGLPALPPRRPAADCSPPTACPSRRFDERADAAAWAAAAVPGAPYAVAVGARRDRARQGHLQRRAPARERARGRRARGRGAVACLSRSTRSATRRGRRLVAPRLPGAGGRGASLARAGALGAVVRPGDAEAYHFCGHIYTTDGCPHPTGLPRIDRDGFPLRAEDGRPVDDLGRLIDAARPAGRRATACCCADPEGRPLPLAPRTRVCAAAARDYAITTQIDGAWYRCCGGHVRKLDRLLRAQPQRGSTATPRCGLLLHGPEGVLRHVLPDHGAVLTACLLAAAARRRRDRSLVAVRPLDGGDARAARATPAGCAPPLLACATFALGALAGGARRSAALALAGAALGGRRTGRGRRGARWSPWRPPPARRAARGSSRRSAARCRSTGAACCPCRSPRGLYGVAARARLHDLRPLLRRVGAGRDQRRARRSGARARDRARVRRSAARCP